MSLLRLIARTIAGRVRIIIRSLVWSFQLLVRSRPLFERVLLRGLRLALTHGIFLQCIPTSRQAREKSSQCPAGGMYAVGGRLRRARLATKWTPSRNSDGQQSSWRGYERVMEPVLPDQVKHVRQPRSPVSPLALSPYKAERGQAGGSHRPAR
jgi:hypothetical protein